MLTRQELDTRVEVVRGFLAVSAALRHIAIKTDAYRDKETSEALDDVSNHIKDMLARLEKDMQA